jgi:hypothetical protein
MFIFDTPARAVIQGTKSHHGNNGCPRSIEEGEFIDNKIMVLGVDCASRTAGNKSTMTEEPSSDEVFIAFDADFLNVNFLKQMVNMSCEYFEILTFPV